MQHITTRLSTVDQLTGPSGRTGPFSAGLINCKTVQRHPNHAYYRSHGDCLYQWGPQLCKQLSTSAGSIHQSALM